MNMDEHCAKLVRIKNVTFNDADGNATFAPSDNSAPIVGGCVNRTLNGFPASKLVIRTSTYAKFAANKLPYDEVNKKPRVVNITGIATRYSGTWQILIRKESDIEIVN
jgi:DNA/RNA endonuclease YhcR with UshA esterase domain